MNKDILLKIGLTNYEIDIYLTLLKNEQLSVYELAKKTGLYRQVCYDSLNRLLEKGYVNSVKQGAHLIFSAINPAIISEYLSNDLDQFKVLLPELMQLRNTHQDKLVVETYTGKNVIKLGLKDIINSLNNSKDKEILCTAIDESIPLAQDKLAVKQYGRDLINFKLKERVIIKKDGKGIFNRKTTQYKKISAQYFNPNPMQIYGCNIQIYLWGNPNYLIIIRNKEIADSYKKQFELLWKTAE